MSNMILPSAIMTSITLRLSLSLRAAPRYEGQCEKWQYAENLEVADKNRDMSGKDFGGYKRIVQYFWDPEPKNDDPSDSPIWCLGRCHDAQPRKDIDTSRINQGAEESGHAATASENAPQSNTPERKPADGETKAPTPPIASRTEDREWPSEFLDDFESRIWMTYRSNFPNIRRSDAPNASASMTFAPAGGSRRVHFGHRLGMYDSVGAKFVGKRTGNITAGERRDISLFSLLDEFLTAAQIGDEACNSVRKGKCSVYSPTTRVLLSRYTNSLNMGLHLAASTPENGLGPLRPQDAYTLSQQSARDLKVYINGDGADVYEDRLLSLATSSEGKFSPTLVLVGIRLGIDRVTPAYWEALKASLQLPQSVGIAGGRPSSSHYFVGHQGDSFFFLDPHQPRPALPRYSNVDEYSKEDIDSCHTRRLRRIPIQEMDPSMLIGFLIRDRGDWDDWRRRVTDVPGKPVVHVADKEPMMIGQVAERPGAVDEVEMLDDDEDEGDGELIERPT
ncbi:MAG: hypothetical protein L6R42_004696 [Xanthoria sp. 1 TBL-2021]|nr:MAG: hypothetical protein L6R42_004696 [Xanthoria sp. 1 TBL-2021]